MRPFVFDVLSQPPQILGLPDKALIPFAGALGCDVLLSTLAQIVSLLCDFPEGVSFINGLGWFFMVGFTYPLVDLLKISLKGKLFLMSLMGILGVILLPKAFLEVPLGWMVTIAGLYIALKRMVRLDAYRLNSLEGLLRTPSQQSHLALLPQERRYV